MNGRTFAALAAAGLVLTACEIMPNKSTALAPQETELGPFGLPVGEPINVISATRGDGESDDPSRHFGKFTVTFNNAAGTDITIVTPEGESINLTEADLEWAGSDGSLGGMEIARFTSGRGDRVDVVIGSARVPLPPPPVENGVEVRIAEEPDTEEVPVVALGRLDEVDTRAGFESYGVVGGETDPLGLPRYQEDVFVGDDEEPTLAGSLAEGTAYYEGKFLASVFAFGELRSDEAVGWTGVGIDFATGEVDVEMWGSYRYDDTDDVAPGAVVDVIPTFTTINGITYVTGVTPVYGNPVENQNIVTGIEVTRSGWFGHVTSVTPVYDQIRNGGENIVTNVNFATSSTGDIDVVTDITVQRAWENDDNYAISLEGSGGPADVSFDNGVQYSGELSGSVEVSLDKYGNTWSPEVEGTFAGAVYGPGAEGDTVDAADFGETVDATTTAGVFEAGGGAVGDGDPTVQIVGGYIAEGDGFDAAEFEPVPEPEPEPAAE